MAITQVKSVVLTRENGSTFFDPRWIVQCDQCKNSHNKEANEPGLADYYARKAGYRTVNVGLTKPLAWLCRACTNRVLKSYSK